MTNKFVLDIEKKRKIEKRKKRSLIVKKALLHCIRKEKRWLGHIFIIESLVKELIERRIERKRRRRKPRIMLLGYIKKDDTREIIKCRAFNRESWRKWMSSS